MATNGQCQNIRQNSIVCIGKPDMIQILTRIIKHTHKKSMQKTAFKILQKKPEENFAIFV